MKNIILTKMFATFALALITLTIFEGQNAKADIRDLPASLMNLKAGGYSGEIDGNKIKAVVLPSSEKLGTFLIVLYLPDLNLSKIMSGEFIPEVNAIAMIPMGLSSSHEELEKQNPAAIMKLVGAQLVITPQANSSILQAQIKLDKYESNINIINVGYEGQYVDPNCCFIGRIFGSDDCSTNLNINSNGLVDSTLEKSVVRVTGQFRMYQEVEGVINFHAVTLNQNMQTVEDAKISAIGVLIQEGSNTRLLISKNELSNSNNRSGSAFDGAILLKKN
jgi:hypothetical protein